MSRGYFEIGIYHPKTPMNAGTLWRSAYQLGASGIFTIGERYPQQASDTPKAWKHIPYRIYKSFEDFKENLPLSTPIIAIEMDGKPLWNYCHPSRGIYLLGAEDHGLPENIIKQCHEHIQLESFRSNSYNVAVAGSIVMYHRQYSGLSRAI